MTDEDYTIQDLRKFFTAVAAEQISPHNVAEFVEVINAAAMLEAYITTGQSRVVLIVTTGREDGVTACCSFA